MDVSFPDVPDLAAVPTGDMPGDKVQIGEGHVDKARAIFPELWRQLEPLLADGGRAVVAVCGGSGVGKSETGSLLAYGLNARGVGAYVLSGDNYPRRVPSANDAERLRTYRVGGTRGLVAAGLYDDRVREELAALQASDGDADRAQVASHPWLSTYQRAARKALSGYLGTPEETDFDEVSGILAAFHAGAPALMLKRMGRTPDELWYDAVDVRDVRVVVIEWTHGNSDHLTGVDIPILLNSTPKETLAHRRARSRDGAVDSPFTTTVLELEQAMLHAQAPKARIIVSKAGELLDYPGYLAAMGADLPGAGPMLNVYPDSIGGTLADVVAFVRSPELADVFSSAYLLPSVFNTDLDRGFSVIDYSLSDRFATRADLDALAEAGIDLKFDFILNHASVLSPQFQDILARGERSEYADFFIDWNAFWAGHGELTAEGFVQPDPELIRDMFFRKPGLPILMVRLPDGTEKPYWNTFYQEVRYTAPDIQELIRATGLQYGRAEVLAGRVASALAEGLRPGEADFTGYADVRDAVVDLVEGRRTYLGQMDLNIASPLVWDFYADTLDRLAGYGAQIVRLDAFAYAPKEPGARNFLNDPGTWDLLAKVKELADRRGLILLPEIHSTWAEGIHEVIAGKGFMTYDFFLPGLLIDAIERADASVLKRWIAELRDKGIRTVNMLGCHDGIPVLDLQGLLEEDRIQALIATIVGRGGYVKDLHGAKNVYYQVNATYYSALGEREDRLLLARAIQLFMPGKPQVWYLDLFASANDHAAVERAGAGGHKEINRTNLSAADVAAGLGRPVVQRQLELLRFRNTFGAFGFAASCEVADTDPDRLVITWRRDGLAATLDADLASASFTITATELDGTTRTI
ncbi:MAG: sucrose phosphorylase [Propionicimonas sp.]|uniref:sucrose phosphorylase n=1 Tax=Propionicimonas sp. TaxID=1955623 RepID=UPI003D09F29B